MLRVEKKERKKRKKRRKEKKEGRLENRLLHPVRRQPMGQVLTRKRYTKEGGMAAGVQWRLSGFVPLLEIVRLSSSPPPSDVGYNSTAVSYTHLTLPTT